MTILQDVSCRKLLPLDIIQKLWMSLLYVAFAIKVTHTQSTKEKLTMLASMQYYYLEFIVLRLQKFEGQHIHYKVYNVPILLGPGFSRTQVLLLLLTVVVSAGCKLCSDSGLSSALLGHWQSRSSLPVHVCGSPGYTHT